MRRTAHVHAAALLLVIPLLAACGDDAKTDTPAVAPTAASDATTTRTPRDRTGRQPTTPGVKLPDAPPLGDSEAASILRGLTEDLAGDDLSRSVLHYLHDLGQTSGVDAARAQLLVESDGEFDDDEAASLGLEMLLLAGDQQAANRIVTLAELLIEDEVAGPATAFALCRVEGPLQAKAEGLLAKIAADEDDEAAQIAIEELARRRSSAAASGLATLVADETRDDSLRGSALALMAATRHPGVQTAAETLFASDADLSDVALGLGIEGATESVPLLERLMTIALDEGAADFEFASACDALAVIHGSSEGTEKARALIAAWLAADDSMACEESIVALWKLGDETQAPHVARVLIGEVARASYIDTGFAVEIIEEIAKRRLARDPRFRKAVDAAAVATADPSRPGMNLNVEALRAAAAYAYLMSR